MAPRTTFIAMIKRWHVIAVLAITLVFGIATARHLGDALFSFVAVPVIVFTLAFLGFAATSRRYNARQNFPSVLLVISAFSAVGITGAMLESPVFRDPLFILLGATVVLAASGMFVLMSSLMWPKIRD